MSSVDLKADSPLEDKRVTHRTPSVASPAANPATKPADKNVVPQSLEHPLETLPLRVYWPYAISLTVIHLLGLLALYPPFFSTSGLFVAIVAHILFDGFGVSMGYHRLLTHRGFECPRWMEHAMAICGICTLQDSPARWVAVHRMHHQYSDHRPDPHSPLVDFLWGHVGWLLFIDRRHDTVHHFERYARDLLRDPFYFRMERKLMWLWVYLAHALVIYRRWFRVGLVCERMVRRYPDGHVLVRMGSDCSDHFYAPRHLGCEFSLPPVGLSQLRDTR